MSQGADSPAQICENLPPPTTTTTTTATATVTGTTTTSTSTSTSTEITTALTTLTENARVPVVFKLATDATTTRRPRFGTSGPRTVTYLVVDGKVIPSALAWRKKWPPRRVSFPTNDTNLVTGYLEPANPWQYAENVNREDLISTYMTSCKRHSTEPLESVVTQLEKLDLSEERCSVLDLKGQKLERSHCEPLEEILKRVQFFRIDLEGTTLDDESAVALFDMIEYYESAVQLNISSNQSVGTRGWQACSHMIKKTNCLEQLEAKRVTLNEQHMPILSRALRIASHLQILKLENCGLAGRPTIILVAALKLNTGLKELYLADNDLEPQDAMQLGALLRTNNHLQLLDVSNNNVQDTGVAHISDGLIEQRVDDKDGRGLNILVLWNNHLTRNSSQHFSRAIARSKSLEMLNIGQNALANETLHIMKDSLQQNRTLLRLGLQSTHLTCEGAIALADIITENRFIQRIDVRDNHIQNSGLKALAAALKKNRSVTQLDLDDLPRRKLDGALEAYKMFVTEIRECCARNEEPCSSDETTSESESPEHRSRLSSVSSRKISLTCQTLPRSPPPIPDVASRSLLEPKRTSGGRLRSPAPSPIPSPSASPIPSPSRGRFVVSRVSETSSTNSSASSSPVTPPSLGSSPTCLFPPAAGASRFRVTVVEIPKNPSPKSVIASNNTNVTVGFRFKLDTEDRADSDDSNDVFSDGDTNETNTPDINSRNQRSDSVGSRNTEDMKTTDGRGTETEITSEVTVKVQKVVGHENRCVVKGILDESTESPWIYDDPEPEVSVQSENCLTDDQYRSRTRRRKLGATEKLDDPEEAPVNVVQKQPSSLEKLLSLFQHPGSLFSGSSSEKTESKNPLQSGVSSVMALGDKFHQYIMEGRCSRDTSPQPSLQRSASDASQATAKGPDPVKSASVPQLSEVVSSRVEEPQPRLSEQSLPDNVQSKVIKCVKNEGEIGISVDLDHVNSQPVTIVDGVNGMCAPKLKDIPEYSVLDISGESCAVVKCDSGTTDSINLTSDRVSSDSSRCNVICDRRKVVSVVTLVGTPDARTCESTTRTNAEQTRDSVNHHNGLAERISDPEEAFRPSSPIRWIPEPADHGTNREAKSFPEEAHVDPEEGKNDPEEMKIDHEESKIGPEEAKLDLEEAKRCVDRVTRDLEGNEVRIGNKICVHDANSHFRVADKVEYGREERVELKNIEIGENERGGNPEDESCGSKIVEEVLRSFEKIESGYEVVDCSYNFDHEEVNGNHEEVVTGIEVECDRDSGNNGPVEVIHDPEGIVLGLEEVASGHEEVSECVEAIKSVREELRSDLEPMESYDEASCRLEEVNSSLEETNSDLEEARPESRQHRTSSARFASAKSSMDFDRPDPEELIFNMTDISTDTIIEESVSSLDSTLSRSVESVETSSNSGSFSKNSSKSRTVGEQSPTSLFAERSRSVHRNSHDSGIEETNLSVSDDSIPENETKRAALFQEASKAEFDPEWTTNRIGVNPEDDHAETIMTTEKDAFNNNRDLAGGFEETLKSLNFSNNDTKTDLEEVLEIGKGNIIYPRSDTRDTENTIEELMTEVTLDAGRDKGITGCPPVVCSTSQEWREN